MLHAKKQKKNRAVYRSVNNGTLKGTNEVGISIRMTVYSFIDIFGCCGKEKKNRQQNCTR